MARTSKTKRIYRAQEADKKPELMNKDEKPAKKEKDPKAVKKIVRGIIQIVVIVLCFAFLIGSFFVKDDDKYKPYDGAFETAAASGVDNGFIALSYFSVDRSGTQYVFSQAQLKEHLRTLKESGYVTITQDDLKRYLKGEIYLPERSLFLLFEDGRRDSAVFAEPLLKDYNYIATMTSYAENLKTENSTKLLSGSDLEELRHSTFWELGTNGYRLSYINVFDRYGNYFGELPPPEFTQLRQYMRREYNHYLMDYIRDEYDIPMESNRLMRERVKLDYQEMEQLYQKYVGELPWLYVLMHSNTNQYGTNGRVSEENEFWIGEYFDVNFNREGNCFNEYTQNINVYDLTRMEPQPYWSKNHLLMRIWGDTGMPQVWQLGDATQAAFWTILNGAVEYEENKVNLTSLPNGTGKLRFKDETLEDVVVRVNLNGNKFGNHTVALRSSEGEDQYIRVVLKNNVLSIYERQKDEEESTLYTLDLDVHDGVVYQTMEEHRQESLSRAIKVKNRQTYKPEESKKIAKNLEKKKSEPLFYGSMPYVPDIQVSDPQDRKMEISLIGETLKVAIDGKQAARVSVTVKEAGSVELSCIWGGYGYMQRNLADDVYDGVFKDLMIEDVKTGEIKFDNRLQNEEMFADKLIAFWQSVLDWFSSMGKK
ncbi:MAG: glycoside hydrolase [Ruminococcaceae bacterium]|nr:glycoside hydrolase [Oscillospiraceae bacterium]